MSDPVIITEDHGRVRVITINRPQALNSMNNAVFAGIRDELAAAEADNEVAVAVITGEGRAFSAGQDLQEMQDGLSGEGAGDHQFPAMLKQRTEFKKPLVAAVNGLGVGIEMKGCEAHWQRVRGRGLGERFLTTGGFGSKF